MLGISSGLSKGASALKSIVKSGLIAWYRSDSIQAPLGEEEIANNSFVSSDNWTAGTGWVIANGVATHTGSTGNLESDQLLVSGKKYQATVVVDSIADNSCNLFNSSDSTTYDNTITSAGTHVVEFTATHATSKIALRTASSNLVVSSFSVREITNSVRDYSNNSYNATMHSGTALEFVASESDKIDFGNPGYNLKTVAFWIQVADVTSNEEPIMEFKTSNGISSDNGTITTAGTWTGKKIYVDGVEASSITAGAWHRVVLTTTAAIVVDDFVVGYDDSTYGDFKIANLQIYDVVWDSSDVTYDYNNPHKDVFQNGTTSILTSNCKALYRFNEGAGTRVYNSAPVLSEELLTGNISLSGGDTTGFDLIGNPIINNAGSTDDFLDITSSSSPVSNKLVEQTITTEVGQLYVFEFELVSSQIPGETATTVAVVAQSGQQDGIEGYTNVPGVKQLVFEAAATSTTMSIRNGDSNLRVRIKNLSAKKITLSNNYAVTGAAFVKTQTHIPQLAALSYSKKLIFTDDSVDIDVGAQSIADNQAFSVSFWYAQTADSTSHNYILAKHESTEDYIRIYHQNTHIEFRVGNGTIITFDIPDLTDFKLSHIVLTRASGSDPETNVYVNGVLEGTDSSTNAGGVFEYQQISGAIGSGGTANAGTFFLDELAILNKELSITEVREIFNAGNALNVRDHSASSNLIGYWRNNGADTWHDLSTNSNDGTVNGTPTTIKLQEVPYFKKDVLGLPMNRVRQRGLNFEEGAARTDKIQRDNAGAITLEAWVYPYREGTTNQAVIGTSGTQYLLYRPLSSNYYRLYINGGTPDDDMAAQTSNLALRQWHHIVAVYDKTLTNEQNIYVNGVSNNTHANADADGFSNPVNGAINADVATTDSYTSIGEYGSMGNFYGGIIDDVKIYDRRLTIEEIKRNYRATKRGHTDNTSLWSDDFNQMLV
jgi:hypothetical protein